MGKAEGTVDPLMKLLGLRASEKMDCGVLYTPAAASPSGTGPGVPGAERCARAMESSASNISGWAGISDYTNRSLHHLFGFSSRWARH
jgi:hypothetical protein